MLPCPPVFSKFSAAPGFEVPASIVEFLVRPVLTKEALLEVLGLDAETLLTLLRGAVLAAKTHHMKVRRVRELLEEQCAHLTGDERSAADMLVAREKRREGEAMGIGVQLVAAVRMLRTEAPFAVSQHVFMEAVTPAARAIRNDPVYLAWLETVEAIVKSPAEYFSATHLAMEYIYFDIETTGLLPDGRMTCAVTQHGDDVRTWASASGEPGEKKYTVATEETVNELVEYLWECGAKGTRVVTFNGANFDFRVLLEHLTDDAMRERCTQIAKAHFDLHLSCIESGGHRMALNGLVLGTLGNQSKSGSGLDAIKWFNDGDYDNLFEYCKQDVLLLKLLWCHAADNGMLFYLPKRAGSARKAVAIEDMDKSAFELNPSAFADY